MTERERERERREEREKNYWIIGNFAIFDLKTTGRNFLSFSFVVTFFAIFEDHIVRKKKIQDSYQEIYKKVIALKCQRKY